MVLTQPSLSATCIIEIRRCVFFTNCAFQKRVHLFLFVAASQERSDLIGDFGVHPVGGLSGCGQLQKNSNLKNFIGFHKIQNQNVFQAILGNFHFLVRLAQRTWFSAGLACYRQPLKLLFHHTTHSSSPYCFISFSLFTLFI